MKPTLSELEKFEDQPEGIDLEVVTESTGMRVTVGNPAQGEGGPRCAAPRLACVCPAGKEREHNFQPGDNVEVCEGELINLQGKILSVDGNKITIMPKHEDLKVGAAPPVCACWVASMMKAWSIPELTGFSLLGVGASDTCPGPVVCV